MVSRSSVLSNITSRDSVDSDGISSGVVEKMMSKEHSGDVNELQNVLDKLTRLKQRYSSHTSSPPKAAARKAMVTKLMNKMGRYIKIIKPETDEYKD